LIPTPAVGFAPDSGCIDRCVRLCGRLQGAWPSDAWPPWSRSNPGIPQGQRWDSGRRRASILRGWIPVGTDLCGENSKKYPIPVNCPA